MYFFYGDLWVKFYKSIGEIWICCINYGAQNETYIED